MEKEYAAYLLKKTKDNYNQIADNFSRYRTKPWSEVKFLFDDYIKPGDKVLDLGCGRGQFLEFLRGKNVEYIGVDFSEKLIEIAKKQDPEAKYQVADVLRLPFPDDYFNKVYAIALFHHIPSKELRIQALKEIERVLKEKGLSIFTVWNLWQKKKTRKLIYKFALLKIFGKSKLDFEDILMDWERMKDCYFHCFTKNELRKLLEKAQFSIIKDGEVLVGLERKKRPNLPNSNLYVVAEKKL